MNQGKTAYRLIWPLLWSIVVGFSCYADSESMQPAALDYCGVRRLQAVDPNLNGSGVVIAAVCRSATYRDGRPQDDYHFNMTHQAFSGGDVVFRDGSTGLSQVSAHSTAIGGILLGYDPGAYHPDLGPFFYKGICPSASVDVYEFWRFLTLVVNQGKALNADILTMSLGDLYEDWWTRGIEYLIDTEGILAVASAGNGTRAKHTVLYPAAGANVLAVGVLNADQISPQQYSLDSFNLPRPQSSSEGPTADQRCKPDLVAPGRCVVPAAYSPMDYEIRGDYSSLAAPVVAGAAALLTQAAENDPNISPYFSRPGTNCLLKAILTASACKLPWWHKGEADADDDHTTVLDYRQGAGMLDAVKAYTVLTEGKNAEGSNGWDLNQIGPERSGEQGYRITADPNVTHLAATLAWNRHYQSAFPFQPLYEIDRDLRLELWTDNSDEPTLIDYSDSPNDNLEHLYTPLDPNVSEYRLVVRFSNAGTTDSQAGETYAVAWTTGSDQTNDNRWWNDLNDDGIVNVQDQLLESIMDGKMQNPFGPKAMIHTLNISAERLDLLNAQWQKWKRHLGRWDEVLIPSAATAGSQTP